MSNILHEVFGNVHFIHSSTETVPQQPCIGKYPWRQSPVWELRFNQVRYVRTTETSDLIRLTPPATNDDVISFPFFCSSFPHVPAILPPSHWIYHLRLLLPGRTLLKCLHNQLNTSFQFPHLSKHSLPYHEVTSSNPQHPGSWYW